MNSRSSAFRPVIPRDHGSTKEVVSRLIAEAGGTKEVAFRLGLAGPTSVQAYSDPSTRTQITYDQVRRLTSRAATAAAEDLALLAGGKFVPGDGPSSEDVPTLAARSTKEFGEWIASVLAGCGPAEQCRELDDLIRVLLAVRPKYGVGETTP